MAVHTVGFVGFGIMGGPMAANLVKAGFDVVGHNRSRGKVERLIAAGGRGADSAAEAARDRDVVISAPLLCRRTAGVGVAPAGRGVPARLDV